MLLLIKQLTTFSSRITVCELMAATISPELAIQLADLLRKTNESFEEIVVHARNLLKSHETMLSGSYWLGSLLPELSMVQRILVHYITAELNHIDGQSVNGFATPILDAADSAGNIKESYFVWQLLSRPVQFIEEIKSSSPDVVAQQLEAMFSQDRSPPKTATDIAAGIKSLRFESKLQVTSTNCMHTVAVPPFLHLKSNSAVSETAAVALEDAALHRAFAAFKTYIDDPSATEIQPRFAQLPPPVMELGEDELLWDYMFIEDAACLLWDPNQKQSSGSNHNEGNVQSANIASALSQLQVAIHSALSPKQQQELAQQLRANPFLLRDCQLTSDQIPGLVEHNWSLCAAVIGLSLTLPPAASPPKQQQQGGPSSSLNQEGEEAVLPLLRPLLQMELSLHSIEVVHALSEEVPLQTDFLRLYTAHCLTSCEKMADKGMQGRFVRLVCVLLQSLLRKYASLMRTQLAEIQSFCLTFPKVKESTVLYRMIKSLEGVAAC